MTGRHRSHMPLGLMRITRIKRIDAKFLLYTGLAELMVREIGVISIEMNTGPKFSLGLNQWCR